ncbi:hypothetical protein Vadar_005008 [Vaccinium darrowii]|uniref:Uncharacterized protein n=1 Tax=Vaccinium darrowii TaxID=229202 RepID=A0ACB7XWY2_9ERIC|nr:hypothetical protein Vadar_005008 [Vaccinium darrowii]
MKKSIILLLLFVFTLSSAFLPSQCKHSSGDRTYNVLDFGAAGDGDSDDTQAFKDAWEATCGSRAGSPATMHVPSGSTFFLQPIVFAGPCTSDVNIVINGTLIAPGPSQWKCKKNKCKQWITFDKLNNLHISGSGTINGEGKKWWGCKEGFVILHSNNVYIRDLAFMDSPQKHIGIDRSKWVYVTNLVITASENSPNTDGIHIQRSQHVFIDHTHIATGDDCISIGDGSAYLNISSITCGPGHGISVGSLGHNGAKETVEHVYVSDVELRGTSNGVRIKTWQGGRGHARDITFERITSYDSQRPIIIDQFYCNGHHNCKNHKSAVEVSNVRYNHIHGTSRGEIAVEFACSETVPCRDIYMNDINLVSGVSSCQNVRGTQHEVSPSVPCLT